MFKTVLSHRWFALKKSHSVQNQVSSQSATSSENVKKTSGFLSDRDNNCLYNCKHLAEMHNLFPLKGRIARSDNLLTFRNPCDNP